MAIVQDFVDPTRFYRISNAGSIEPISERVEPGLVTGYAVRIPSGRLKNRPFVLLWNSTRCPNQYSIELGDESYCLSDVELEFRDYWLVRTLTLRTSSGKMLKVTYRPPYEWTREDGELYRIHDLLWCAACINQGVDLFKGIKKT